MIKHSVKSLTTLTWGKVKIVDYAHPLSQGISGIASSLDLPRDSLPGCDFCIRVNDESFGATERLVISSGIRFQNIIEISTAIG